MSDSSPETTAPRHPVLDKRNLLLTVVLALECAYGMYSEDGQVADMMVWLVVFTALAFNVLRRAPASSADTRWWVGVICFCSFMRTFAFQASADDRIYWYLRILGDLLGDMCLLYLGRSFAILPARRKIQTGFLYRFVRHPIYAVYIILDIAFVCIVPSWWNVAVLVIGIGLFITRAHLEEQVLREDPVYESFLQKTRWRFFPGIH